MERFVQEHVADTLHVCFTESYYSTIRRFVFQHV